MRTQSDASLALGPFVHWSQPAPYKYTEHGLNCIVLPARSKTGLAAAARIMEPHAVTSAASVVIDGRVTFAALWMCQGGSKSAVFLAADAPRDDMCKLCAVRSAGDYPGVYRVRAQDGELLYIGSSQHVNERIMQHRASPRWRGLSTEIAVTRYPTREEARAAELRAIHAEHPRLNVLHGARAAA